MTVTQFREQLKALGLGARKRKGLDVYDITSNGTDLCSVMTAELYPISHVQKILEKKLRPEYIPPLG